MEEENGLRLDASQQAKLKQLQSIVNEAEPMACEECNQNIFIKGYVIKRVSSLLSPNGQEMIIPIEVYTCAACGNVNDIFKREIGSKKIV